MKRVLILGASMLQVPAIKKAKELGYYVGVIDYNNQAPGIKYADKYFNISTNDIEKVVEIAKEFKAEGILTLATDMPVRSVAAACKELGLLGITPETAIKATDKGEMMRAFKANSVAHPWFYILSSKDELLLLENELIYPCIFKPTDSSGSRGVILVNNKDEIHEAYKYSKKHSTDGKIIIQEYLQGEEVSVEMLIINGESHILAVTDKMTTGAPHFIETGHSQPSKLNENNIKKIKELAIEAVNAIGINIGAAHVEIMLTNKGPIMIEIGARMGGDYITTHLVPLSTGIDMVSAVILQACGESFDIIPSYSRASLIKYFNAPSGNIKEITGIEKAKKISGVVEVSLLKKEGDTIGSLNSSNDRVGFVIIQEKNNKLAQKLCDDALELLNISIQ